MKAKRVSRSRRNFLLQGGQTALATFVMDSILGSLLQSAANRAWAATSSSPGYPSFLHIHFYGAPPRWMYDLVLWPTGASNDFVANGMVKNVYQVNAAGRYESPGAYKVVASPYKNKSTDSTFIQVPYLLSLQVPKAGGGTRPAMDMLKNMIQIRGIDVLSQAHPGAAAFHSAAVAGSQTISAVTADFSTTDPSRPDLNALRAVGINSDDLFTSTKGYAMYRQTASSGANALAAMFRDLQPYGSAGLSTTLVQTVESLKFQIDDALKTLEPQNVQYYSSLLDGSEASLKLLLTDSIATFQNLDTKWNNLYNKYLNLVTRTLTMTYPLLNDKPIGGTKRDSGIYAFGQDQKAYNPDLRTMIAPNAPNSPTNLQTLAAEFAVAEFLLINGVCPSVTMRPQSLVNTKVKFTATATTETNRTLPFDQHYIGSMPGILANSMYFLAFTACLLELIDRMQATKLPGAANSVFYDTLIYMNGEFNRAPRNDGSGADHGGKGGHVNLFSGRINGFKLVGNVRKVSTSGPPYVGTWGEGDGSLDIVTVWGSVMNLLGRSKSSLPNIIDRSKLIFTDSGEPALNRGYAGTAKNV